MQPTAIAALHDNYIWWLENGQDAAVIDPGEAQPVAEMIGEKTVRLEAILLTHRHADHIGGVAALAAAFPDIPVYGPARERIAGVTHPVDDGDCVELPKTGLKFDVIAVPGHTAGHIAYAGAGMLFCGDSLFACGCGRLFEGSAQDMHQSLQKLGALPDDTLVCAGHEYTLANIRFALEVEPDNKALRERNEQDTVRRNRGEATMPSTIAAEKNTNPFMRCHIPEIAAAAAKHAGKQLGDPSAVFAELRRWKDSF